VKPPEHLIPTWFKLAGATATACSAAGMGLIVTAVFPRPTTLADWVVLSLTLFTTSAAAGVVTALICAYATLRYLVWRYGHRLSPDDLERLDGRVEVDDGD